MRIIDEGEKHITLQHPDGHQVMIAKHAVSKNTLEKIKKFDQGGEVNYGVSKENTLDPQKTADFKKAFSGESQGQSNPKLAQSQVKNPQPVQHYDAGGAVPDPTEGLSPDPSQEVSLDTPSTIQQIPEQGISSSFGQTIGKRIVGPAIQDVKDIGSNISSVAGGVKDFFHGVAQGAGLEEPQKNSDLKLASASPDSSGFEKTDLGVSGSQGQNPENPFLSAINKYLPQFEAAYQKNQGAYSDANKQLQQGLQDYQTHFNDINNQIEALKSNINSGMIDPNHLFNDQSTGQKISTAIGLMLGGLSSGMTGQANPVMQFMNDQINRDIDAQKANIGKNNTLLEANLRQLGNLDAATNMTRLQQMAMLETKLGPGSMAMQMIPQMQKMALQKSIYAGGASGGTPINYALAAKLSADNPEEEKEMMKEAGVLMARDKALNQAQSVMGAINKLQTIGNRLASPFQSQSQIDAFNANLVPLVQAVSPSKRLTPESAKLEIQPFEIKLRDDQNTAMGKLNLLRQYIVANTDPTPYLVGKGLMSQSAAVAAPPKKRFTGPGFQAASFSR